MGEFCHCKKFGVVVAKYVCGLQSGWKRERVYSRANNSSEKRFIMQCMLFDVYYAKCNAFK